MNKRASSFCKEHFFPVLACFGLAFAIGTTGWMNRLENTTQDIVTQFRASPAIRDNFFKDIPVADPRVITMGIDDGSIEMYGRWPWDRRRHAKFLAGGHSLGLRARPKTVVDTGSDLQLANLGDGATKDFSVSDAAPKGTDSVLLQVTAKAAKQPGTLTFWSAGTARPDSVDLSVTPGQSVSGTVVARVGDGRSVRVRNSGAKGVKVRITVLGSFR